MDDFLASVQKRSVIGDGPMGTMLFSRFGNKYQFIEEFNLYKSKEVFRLHRDYIEAGSKLLGASTYNANRIRLGQSPVLNKLEEMNRLGIELAKEAANDQAWVAGKLGTTGKFLQPLGDLSIHDAREAFREQVAILVEAGADLLAIETMSDLYEAQIAYEAVRSVCDLPAVVSFSFDSSMHTIMGVTPREVSRATKEWGVDIVGSNCGIGPDEVVQSISKMIEEVPDQFYWSESNAGLPQLKDGQAVYGVGPKRFADYAENAMRLGVKVISACCGATPDHIRAMVERIENCQK
ncbi:homocysteine S-methyltransferase family protein [Candidatus Latescibacterota bacterium]